MTEPIKFKQEKANILKDGFEARDRVLPPPDLATQLLKRSMALFEQYEVEKNDWQGLALALALKHEPSFKIEVESEKKKKTKPTVWTPVLQFYLWLDVRQFKLDNPTAKSKHLIKEFSSRPEWSGVEISREYLSRIEKSELVQHWKNVESQLGTEAANDAFSGWLGPRREELIEAAKQHINS